MAKSDVTAVSPQKATVPKKTEPERMVKAYVIGRGRQHEGGTVCYVLELPESVFKAHIVERRQPNLRTVVLRELDRELATAEESGQWEP